MADVKDLLTRWKEVVKTIGFEQNTATPGDKPKWQKAADTAQAVVVALDSAVALEKVACAAWAEARQEKSDKPKPVFTIVPSGH